MFRVYCDLNLLGEGAKPSDLRALYDGARIVYGIANVVLAMSEGRYGKIELGYTLAKNSADELVDVYVEYRGADKETAEMVFNTMFEMIDGLKGDISQRGTEKSTKETAKPKTSQVAVGNNNVQTGGNVNLGSPTPTEVLINGLISDIAAARGARGASGGRFY